MEVIISSFQFVPLGTPQPAALKVPPHSSLSPFRFDLYGEFDRWYEVQTSTDLFSWQSLATLPATNPVVGFSDNSSDGLNQRSCRTITGRTGMTGTGMTRAGAGRTITGWAGTGATRAGPAGWTARAGFGAGWGRMPTGRCGAGAAGA